MPLIESVSDTARWVAYYRAMETARPDAVFRDPYAERLAGPKGLEAANAPFKFGPAEGTAFFEPMGWREIEYRSTGEEAKRIDRRMKGMWFWELLFRFYPRRVRESMRRFSGIVLLGRATR